MEGSEDKYLLNLLKKNDDEYYIKEYNLDNIKAGIITIIGARSDQKSMLVKDILFQKRANTIGRIFIRNENVYTDLCHPYSITKSYNSYLLMEVLDEQKKDNTNTQIVLFDDVLSLKGDWIKDKNIIELIEKAKELNILVIFCFTFSFGFNKLYESVDCVFMMEEYIISNRKRLYEHYGSAFKNFSDFEKVLTTVCYNNTYNSFVIENKKNIYKYTSSNIDLQKYKISYPCVILDEHEYSGCISVNLPKSNSNKSSKSSSTKSSKSSSDYYFNLLANKNTNIKPNRTVKINLKTDIITIIKEDNTIEIEI